MHFAHPTLLWIAPPALALLGAFLFWAGRKKRSLLHQFTSARLLPKLVVRQSTRRDKIRIAFLLGTVALLFLTLARPQWGFSWEEARQRGLDIVVAIDTSRSMLATDVTPNRLTRAKLAALDLLRLAHRDRLGLVAFSGTAFLQCPLTLDDEAFRQNVEALNTGIIPQGGTAIAPAIQAALAAFKDEDNFKILVLITDGEDHDQNADPAVQAATKAGLRVFTLGVGTPAGEIIQVTDPQGQRSYIKDDAGNVVKSRLNESLLQQIATATGGFYLPLRGPEVIETLYAQGLAPLPKSDFTSRLVRQYHERFHWPLALALLCIVAEWLLPHPRSQPYRSKTPTRAAVATVVLAAFIAGSPAQSSPAPETSGALDPQNRARYEQEFAEYQKLLEENPDDTRLHYNAGTAAYHSGRFDEAARAFTNATRSPDLSIQQRGYYNLGSTLFRLGEQSEPVPEKARLWSESVRNFEAALKLDTNDLDARFNLDLVQARLAQLPKPPPDSGDGDNKEQKEEDSNADNQEQKGKEPSPEQPDQPSPGKEGNSEPPDSPQASPPNPNPDASGSPQSPESPDQPEPGDGSPPSGGGEQEPNEQSGTGPTPEPADQMSRAQAEQFLDGQKGEARAMIFLPQFQTNRSNAEGPYHDW